MQNTKQQTKPLNGDGATDAKKSNVNSKIVQRAQRAAHMMVAFFFILAILVIFTFCGTLLNTILLLMGQGAG